MSAELTWAPWGCAVCGSANETAVDPALGARQQFTEDCAACCRPNLLTALVQNDGSVEISAEFDE